MRRFDLPRCARHLINLALENGGTDNVSVCLVEVLDE
jgi:serine/threonine protein phosphatase PrpC